MATTYGKKFCDSDFRAGSSVENCDNRLQTEDFNKSNPVLQYEEGSAANPSNTESTQNLPHSEVKHCDFYFDSSEDSPLELSFDQEESNYFRPNNIFIVEKGKSVCSLHNNRLLCSMNENVGWILDICNLFMGKSNLLDAINIFIPTDYFDRLLVINKGEFIVELSIIHQQLICGLDVISCILLEEHRVLEVQLLRDHDIGFLVTLSSSNWDLSRFLINKEGVKSVRTIQCESLPNVTKKELNDFMNSMNPAITARKIESRKKNKKKQSQAHRDRKKKVSVERRKLIPEPTELTTGQFDNILRSFKTNKKYITMESNDSSDGIVSKLMSIVGENSVVSSIFGPLITCLVQLYRGTNVVDWSLALYQYVNTLSPSWKKSIRDHVEKSVNLILSLFSRRRNEIEQESVSDTFFSVKSFLLRFLHSEIAESIRTTILGLVSLKVFSYDYSGSITKVFGKLEKKMSMMELFELFLTQIGKLVQFGSNLLSGVPLTELLVSGDPHKDLCSKIEDLLVYKNKLVTCDPPLGHMIRDDFIKTSSTYLKQFDVLKSTKNTNSNYVEKLAKLRYSLFNLYCENLNIANSSRRETPLWFHIVGDPSLGKSALIFYIAHLYCVTLGIPFDKQMIFHQQKSSEYHDGYYNHLFWHISEILNKAESLAKKEGEPEIAFLTSLIDDQPFMANMAFEDKAKVFINIKMVISDGNDIEMKNLEYTVSNKAAYLRRCVFIVPTVLPQFIKEGSSMLDVEKSLSSDSLILDRYLFDVFSWKSMSKSQAERVYLLKQGSIFNMTDTVSKFISDHVANGRKKSDRFDREMDPSLYLPQNFKPVSSLEKASSDLYSKEICSPIKDEAKLEPLLNNLSFDGVSSILRDALLEGKESLSSLLTTPRSKCISVESRELPVLPEGEDGSDDEEPLYLPPRPMDLSERIYGVPGQQVNTNSLRFKLKRMSFKCKTLFSRVWRSFPSLTNSYKTLKVGWDIVLLMIMSQFLVIFSKIVSGTIFTYGTEYLLSSWNDKRLVAWEELKYRLNLASKYKPFETPFWAAHGDSVKYTIAALTAVIAGWKLYNSSMFKSEQSEVEEEITAISLQGFSNTLKTDSIYNRDLEEIEEAVEACGSYLRIASKDDAFYNSIIPSTKKGVHTGSLASLYACARRNCRMFKIKTKDSEPVSHLFGLQSNIAIVNTHALPAIGERIYVSNTGKVDKTLAFMETTLDYSNRIDLGGDLSIVALSGVIFSNVMSHITVDDFPDLVCTGMFLTKEVVSRKINGQFVFSKALSSEKFTRDTVWCYEFPEHKQGMCGLPLIIQKNATCTIAAMHAGGADNMGYGIPLDKLILEQSILKLREASGKMMYPNSKPIIMENLTTPHPKSAFVHEPFHGVEYYGKLEGKIVGLNSVSKVEKTRIFDDSAAILKPRLKEQYDVFGPPLMHPIGSGENYVSPYNIALRGLSKQKPSLNNEILEMTVKTIVDHILANTKIPEQGLKPLKMMSVINGEIEDAYLRSLNMSTGSGYGYNGKKLSQFHETKFPDSVVREPKEKLKKQIAEMFSCYKKKRSYFMPFLMTLKDEPREVSKIKLGKTRAFYQTHLAYLVVGKMFLTPFYSLMSEQPEVFFTALGLNVVKSADRLATRLADFSNEMMEGDFKAFDQEQLYVIREAVCEIILRCLKAWGYNSLALEFTRCILSESLFPFIIVLMDIIMAPGSHPSGDIHCTENNSLVNLVMLVYAYIYMTRRTDFFKQVCPCTVGDDIIAAIKSKISSLFNNFTYRDFCKEHYNMTYTPATKGGEMQKILSLTEVTFLKRMFERREDSWIFPISASSILKSLQWKIKSSEISEEQQIFQTICSSLDELYFKFLEDEFNEVRDLLIRSFEKRYRTRGWSFPTYEDIRLRMSN